MPTVRTVAAPDLRIVRRRRGALTAAIPTPSALVAASAPVNSVKDIFKPSMGQQASWQDEAWELYNEVGELGCYVRWRARSCSRVKLIPSEIDPRTGQPTMSLTKDKDGNLVGEAAQVAAIVHSIAGGPIGQAELVERAITLLSVPGELYVAILITAEGERWEALSKRQIQSSRKVYEGITIVLPEGGEHEFTPSNGDGMFRVWNPHANMPTEPDSPVRSNLSPLREIARTTEKIDNSDQSIMNTNGLLVIPAEASLPGAVGPVSAGKPGETPTAGQPGMQTAQTLQAKLVEADQIGSRDKKAQVRRTPLVATVPAEHADKIKHITFNKDISEVEIKKRDAATLRFARGIDMEPDQLLGLGDTNHWNGVLLADQDVNLHVKPPMKTLCNAFFRNVIRPMLVKAGIDPNKYVLTIDASEITADPDKTDEAKEANDAGALTNKALLRHQGLPEDDGYNLTTLEGLQELARDKIAKADPAQFVQVIRDVLPLLDPKIQALNLPEPVQALPSGPAHPSDDHGDPPEEVPVDGSPPDTEGKAPRKPVTAALGVSAEDIAADFYLTAALRLAGNRRVKTNDRVQRDRLRSIEPHDYHRFMPPVDVADVGRLIASYDAGLDDKAAKFEFDADEVRSRVVREVRRRLTSQVVDG